MGWVFKQKWKKCWHWPIFPVGRPTSIFGSAQLNFCVRNGYRWTLCDKNTNSFFLFRFKTTALVLPIARPYHRLPCLGCCLASVCWHWPIFPVGRPTSIFGSAQLNFCVRNGYRWTLCDKNTNLHGAPSGTRTPDPLIKSQLLYQLS